MPKDPDTQEKTTAPTLHEVTQQEMLYDRKTGKVLSVEPEVLTTPAPPLQRKMTRQDMRVDPKTENYQLDEGEIIVPKRVLTRKAKRTTDRRKSRR